MNKYNTMRYVVNYGLPVVYYIYLNEMYEKKDFLVTTSGQRSTSYITAFRLLIIIFFICKLIS